MAISVDTLVEKVHFPRAFAAEHLAWRALAVCASDLAAMGAEPVAFTLALTLPEYNRRWLEAFSQGLAAASHAMSLALIGGDTTRGPLTLTLQVHGLVPAGQALCRHAAQVGDRICVSGTLGEAGAALAHLEELANESEAVINADVRQLLTRYTRPQPRLALGQALRGRARAAIDISDGLASDLQHILARSAVGATLDAAAIPRSPSLIRHSGEQALDLALRAGDDYELCFTWPADQPLPAALAGVPLTQVGVIDAEPGLRLRRHNQIESLTGQGYDHFRH